MTNTAHSPYEMFFGVDGKPLDGGKIYIGNPGVSPIESPLLVWWSPEMANADIVAYPIITRNGVPQRSGAPGKIYFPQTEYSIRIDDKNDSLVYENLNQRDVLSQMALNGFRFDTIAEMQAIPNPWQYLPGSIVHLLGDKPGVFQMVPNNGVLDVTETDAFRFDIGNNRHLARIHDYHYNTRSRILSRYETLLTNIHSSRPLTIACFGDSTTDGFGTTSFTQNPTIGSQPSGTTDHNLDAPNAWPAVLKSMLHTATGNTDIEVYNLGYSGRALADGWARTYYGDALNNPAYVDTPDITYIAFGINDAQLPTDPITDDFEEELCKLIQIIINDGTIPVLVTCDPILLNGVGTPLDYKEIHNEIDRVKHSVSKRYGIPLVDMGGELTKWLGNNKDRQSHSQLMPDGIHFGDDGHRFKASIMFKEIYRTVFNYTGGDQNITTWDSNVKSLGNVGARFTLTNNAQGGNVFWSGDAPSSTDVMDFYVWNESPNWTDLVYLGISNENVNNNNDGLPNQPRVILDRLSLGTSQTRLFQNSGIYQPNDSFRASDVPHIFGKLPYGLSRIRYRTGTYTSAFLGCFRLVETAQELKEVVIGKGDGVFRDYPGSGSLKFISPLPEFPHLANTASFGWQSEVLTIVLEMQIPQGGAVVLLSGQGFDGTAGAVANNQQSSLILYRGSLDDLAFYLVQWDKGGVVAMNILSVTPPTVPLVWTSNRFRGRVEFRRGTDDVVGPDTFGTQNVRLFDVDSGGSALINHDITNDSFRWGGTVGGFFYNNTLTSSAGRIEIEELIIKRSYPSVATA